MTPEETTRTAFKLADQAARVRLWWLEGSAWVRLQIGSITPTSSEAFRYLEARGQIEHMAEDPDYVRLAKVAPSGGLS